MQSLGSAPATCRRKGASCAQLQQLFGLDDTLHAKVLERFQRIYCKPGRTLFRQGALHKRSYIVDKGLIRTFYAAASGREITLSYWSEGDIVGGPNFFGGAYHIWSGVAVRQSILLSISGQDLRSLAHEYPQIALWLADALIYKLRWMSILVQLHGAESVRNRLARLVLMLSEIHGISSGDDIIVKHRMNQSDLAALVGASRQWINRTLKDLQSDGYLSVEDCHIRIRNLDGLRQLIGDDQFQ